jgi:two-component system, NtrC family, response regulator AtoC
MSQTILIVDDDPYTRKLFDGLLRNKGYELRFAANAAEGRAQFRDADFNLIIMDQRLPGGEGGLELLREMRAERPRQVALLATGYASVRDAIHAVHEGLFDYLTKPFENLEELEAVIERALELDRAYREIESLKQNLGARSDLPRMIGRSPAIKRLQQQIEQVAPLDTTVLVAGESGTGKELVARTLHARSARATGRMLEINCGAVSEQLLESTLFGFEKGAFTGAARTTPGCFEDADGGTLFLDEISDMSPRLQSSLLRVLQQRTFSRLGSTEPRRSDFRLICATNRPLAEEVRAGHFREDLYYRINVVALQVPPLRERHEDIVLLAAHFLEHFNQKFDKQVGPLTQEALALLEEAQWPGNVRQLQHAIERVVALKPAGPVGAADLACICQGPDAELPGGTPLDYEAAREAFEREYVTELIRTAQGNMSEAARLSGLSRQNLYVRMKRWGIVIE